MNKQTKKKKPKRKNVRSYLSDNKNLDTMKILVSWDKFNLDVLKLRKVFSIPPKGFSNNEKIKKWNKKLSQDSDAFWETKDYKNKRKKLLLLKKKNYTQFLIEQDLINKEVPINKFNQAIKNLIKKYNLPYNFLETIRLYIYHNKILPIFLPVENFSLCVDTEARNGTAKWVEIKAYTRLTEKDIRNAMNGLRKLQKHFLPPVLTGDIRKHQDVDRALTIEREMQKRIKKIYQKPDSYLETVKKQYGKEEFERVKKLNPQRVEREIIKYTSKEISKKIFGTSKKDALVRQIYSRLQKERKKRFGGIV